MALHFRNPISEDSTHNLSRLIVPEQSMFIMADLSNDDRLIPDIDFVYVSKFFLTIFYTFWDKLESQLKKMNMYCVVLR